MIIKNIKQTIKEHFFVNPTSKLRVRQIERLLKFPLPSVIRYCKELKKEGIVTTVKTGNVVFYTADRTSESFLLEKKLFNIKQLYESGLVKYIKEELHNPAIIVFGSFAKGEDIESSDIDLYIETASKKEIGVNSFERILKRRVQIFKSKSIKGMPNQHLANNILNGVIVNGFIEVFT